METFSAWRNVAYIARHCEIFEFATLSDITDILHSSIVQNYAIPPTLLPVEIFYQTITVCKGFE